MQSQKEMQMYIISKYENNWLIYNNFYLITFIRTSVSKPLNSDLFTLAEEDGKG